MFIAVNNNARGTRGKFGLLISYTELTFLLRFNVLNEQIIDLLSYNICKKADTGEELGLSSIL